MRTGRSCHEKTTFSQSHSRDGPWVCGCWFRRATERSGPDEAGEDHQGRGGTHRPRESASRFNQKRGDRERERPSGLVVRYRTPRHPQYYGNFGRCENGKDRFDSDRVAARPGEGSGGGQEAEIRLPVLLIWKSEEKQLAQVLSDLCWRRRSRLRPGKGLISWH